MGRLTKRLFNKMLSSILITAMVMASAGVPVNASDVTDQMTENVSEEAASEKNTSEANTNEETANKEAGSNVSESSENAQTETGNTDSGNSEGQEIELTPEEAAEIETTVSDDESKESFEEESVTEEDIEEETEEDPDEEIEEEIEETDEDSEEIGEPDEDEFIDDVEDDPLGSRYKKKRVSQADMIPISSIETDGTGAYDHGNYSYDINISKGIDVSKYQKDIDWEKVKEDGVDFAFIRVGFRGYGGAGTLNEDFMYKENIEGALAASIPVGVYMFSQATSVYEAYEEADYILERIADYNITLPVIMDYEFAGEYGRLERAHLSREEATDVCNAFCERVSEQGYEAMVYADYGMLTNHLYPEEIEENYKIWIARWNFATEYYGDYSSWQFSDIGRVEGISDSKGYIATDLNFGYGLLDIPVTLNAKGGMFEDGEEIILTLEQGTTLLEADYKLPKKEGRTFRGWSLDKTSQKATYNFSEPIIATKLELYAVWRKKKVKKTAVIKGDDIPPYKKDDAENGMRARAEAEVKLTDYVLPEKSSLAGHLFVKFIDADSVSVDNVAEYKYVRGGVRPKVMVYYEPYGCDSFMTEPSENAILLVPGEDYRMRYVNNRRAADYDETGIFGTNNAPTVNIIGRKEYKGSENIRFTIY